MSAPYVDSGRVLSGHRSWVRWAALCLVLLAFGRLVWRLGDKNLWLDEAFSLQRAESAWPALVTGGLAVADSPGAAAVTDPHPFIYYALLKGGVALAGHSEFALRFPSAMAATLLVPLAWAIARRLARQRVMSPAAGLWAALLAAINPFFLWYGQEARMYALVAALAALSTYCLLRWRDAPDRRGQTVALAAYGVSLALLLGAHFFSLLILPAHAGLVYQRLAAAGQPPNRRRGALWALAVLASGLLPGGMAVWQVLREPGSVGHFATVSLGGLALDVLHSFSAGLSLEGPALMGMEIVCCALAVLGALCIPFSTAHGGEWENGRMGGWEKTPLPPSPTPPLSHPPTPPLSWLLPAWLAVPALLLALTNRWHAAYMSSREMSVASPAFLLLVAAGLGLVWERRRWLAAACGLALVAGSLLSTANYFGSPLYEKGDMAGLGDYVRQGMQPGDLLITEPSHWWRLFDYYLPARTLARGAEAGLGTGWRTMPDPSAPWADVAAELTDLSARYHRIWLARTEPHSQIAAWLGKNACRVQGRQFESPVSWIQAELYVPQWQEAQKPAIEHPLDAVFGDRIRLLGYDVGEPLTPDSPTPVTLYWQAQASVARPYKYRLNLMRQGDNAQVAVTDRQPNGGCRPASAWTPGAIYAEYTGVRDPQPAAGSRYYLTLWLYDPDTLARLPVTAVGGTAVTEDGQALVLPLP